LVAVDPPTIQQSNPRTRTGTGLIRLTFDDGPDGYTDQILDILARYNVHATFYVIGQNVHRYPAQMQRTVNEGHKICNHSFTHSNLARMSRAAVADELSRTNAAIQETIGITPDCFRPPYGSYNRTVSEVAASLGMSPVDLWSIDTRDWTRPGSSVIANCVLNNSHSGAVVLLHILNQQTVNTLPSIIEGLRAQGYTLE
jgi:peptidoglycan/xylan/chitin deacetylase (PgdA/CDA1 family)